MNHRSVTILLILCLLGLLSIGAMFGFHHYNAKNAPPKRQYPIFTPAEETEPEPEVPAPTPRKLAEVEARLAAPEEPQTEVGQDDARQTEGEFIYTAPEPEPQPKPQPTTDPETTPDQGSGDPTPQPDPQPNPNEEPNPTPTPDPNNGGGEPTTNQEPGGGA